MLRTPLPKLSGQNTQTVGINHGCLLRAQFMQDLFVTCRFEAFPGPILQPCLISYSLLSAFQVQECATLTQRLTQGQWNCPTWTKRHFESENSNTINLFALPLVMTTANAITSKKWSAVLTFICLFLWRVWEVVEHGRSGRWTSGGGGGGMGTLQKEGYAGRKL